MRYAGSVNYDWGAGPVTYGEESEFVGVGLDFPTVLVLVNMVYCLLGALLESRFTIAIDYLGYVICVCDVVS